MDDPKPSDNWRILPFECPECKKLWAWMETSNQTEYLFHCYGGCDNEWKISLEYDEISFKKVYRKKQPRNGG